MKQMNKTTISILMASAILALSSCGTTPIQETMSSTPVATMTEETKPTELLENFNSEENSTPEEKESPADNALEVPHRSGEEIVGISDKDVSEINMNFAGTVRNDVTENWRYSTISEDIDIENYVLSYYKEYFESDNEIHGIINFTRKTTARLNVFGNMIFLSLHDYVDGEEYDAKLMFSGTPLVSYIIYTDNGDIEKVD